MVPPHELQRCFRGNEWPPEELVTFPTTGPGVGVCLLREDTAVRVGWPDRTVLLSCVSDFTIRAHAVVDGRLCGTMGGPRQLDAFHTGAMCETPSGNVLFAEDRARQLRELALPTGETVRRIDGLPYRCMVDVATDGTVAFELCVGSGDWRYRLLPDPREPQEL